MSKTYKLTMVVLIVALFATLFILIQKPWRVDASVTFGNEYFATSTGRAQADFANYSVIQSPTAPGKLAAGSGIVATSAPTVLGSIVITQTGTSGMCFHDATSTVTNVENATSTRWSTCFPASMAAGTYTYDIQLKHGILVEYLTGQPTANTRASTTVTYR